MSSHLLFMPTQPAPSSPSRHASSSGTTSGSGSPSYFASAPHQPPPPPSLPFSSTTLSHRPSALSFGFGFASPSAPSTPLAASPSAWGVGAAAASTTPRFTPSAPGGAREKRRREEEEDDEMGSPRGSSSTVAPSPSAAGASSTSSAAVAPTASLPTRQERVLPKRMRAGLLAQQQTQESREEAQAEQEEDVDLGNMLATLDKSSLLLLLSRLLSHSPDRTLRSQILTHLPRPTRASFAAALDVHERAVRAALPAGGETVRAEWAWGRLRGPLMAFASGALGLLRFFDTPSNSSAQAAHPSETYDFLLDVTTRLLRLLSQLPPLPSSTLLFSNLSSTPAASHPLASSLPARLISPGSPHALLALLFPALWTHWQRLLTSLTHAVNVEGRMYGAEAIGAWLAGLTALGAPRDEAREEEKAVRAAMQSLAEALEAQIGWLVGGQAARAPSRGDAAAHRQWAAGHMEEEEL